MDFTKHTRQFSFATDRIGSDWKRFRDWVGNSFGVTSLYVVERFDDEFLIDAA